MATPEWLVRHVTFPLHERLRGRCTMQEMRGLTQLASLSRVDLQQECSRRLRALLQFAAERLPYYADVFARVGVDPRGDDPFAELAKLPILRKPEVRAHADRMVDPHVPGGLQRGVSGGTSGDTLHFFVDRKHQSQSMGGRLAMQALLGVRPGDRRMWLWGSPIELRRSRVRRWRDGLINEVVLDAFDMSPTRMDAYLRQILVYRPRLIQGYSSAVAMLARHAARRYAPGDFRGCAWRC